MPQGKIVDTAYDESQAKSYDEKRFTTPQGLLFHSWELEQLQGALDEAPRPGEALEVGCGTGRFIKAVLDAVLSVRGLDTSLEILEICRNIGARETYSSTLVREQICLTRTVCLTWCTQSAPLTKPNLAIMFSG